MFIKNLAYIQSIPSLTFQRYILSVSVTNFYKRSLSTTFYFANTKLFEIDTATIKYVVFKCNNCCEISWQNLNLWNVNTLNAWFVLKYLSNPISLSKWLLTQKCIADSVLISFDYKCNVRRYYMLCALKRNCKNDTKIR